MRCLPFSILFAMLRLLAHSVFPFLFVLSFLVLFLSSSSLFFCLSPTLTLFYPLLKGLSPSRFMGSVLRFLPSWVSSPPFF